MRPLYHYTGHQCLDLTRCEVHCLINDQGKRRIVALVPKVWEKLERQKLVGINGQEVEMCSHVVTDWEEFVLFDENEVK